MRALVVSTRIAVSWLGVPPAEEWVTARAEFLRCVTAASLERVSVPVDWVWVAAPEREAQVREMAKEIYPRAIIVREHSKRDIEEIAPESSFVLVRLDSDDAFLPEALDQVVAMELEPKTLVDWPCGWQLDWNSGRLGEWAWPHDDQGPFLAVTVEDRKSLLRTSLGPHRNARQDRHVVTIPTRSWVQVIHGESTRNDWRCQNALSPESCDEILRRTGVNYPC